MAKAKAKAKLSVSAQNSRDNLVQWEPGQSGNPKGRAKGSRHKLNEEFIAKLADDFIENGADAIVRMRCEKPGDYIRVIASLVPRETTLNVNVYDELTDEQLYERFRVLQGEIAAFLPDDRSGEDGGRDKAETQH